jgi:hypothetical protein
MKKAMMIILFAMLVALILGGCTTFATKQGQPQETLPILSMVPADNRPTGDFIASYWQFLGICFGYDAFAENIKGRGEYEVEIKFYGIISEIRAIKK